MHLKSKRKKLSMALAVAGLLVTAIPAHAYVFKTMIPGLKASSSGVVLPTFSLSPTNLAFGSVAVNGVGAAQGYTLQNTSTLPLVIGATTVSTGGQLVTDACSNKTLAAGASCSGSLEFLPTSAGNYSGSLNIASNAAAAGVIAWTGTGVVPLFTLTPASLSFGSVTVNSTSAAQAYTLTNSGAVPLTIGATTLSGGISQASDTCSNKALAVGASCSGSVTFKPTAATAYSGAISIATNGASAGTVSWTGTGAVPTYTLSPTSLSFGAVPVNTASSAQSYTLKNSGAVPLVIGATTVPSGATLVSDTCSNTTLAVGASCTGSVKITPTSTTSYSGTLSIASNASTTATISLTGYGAENDALLSPANTVATGEANSAWASTGYGWVWNASGYGTSAAVGDVHFETLITNSTGTSEQIYLNAAVDNTVDGLKISGVSQSVGCLASNGFAGACTVGPFTIPPGTTRIDISVNNAGTAANPAGISAWISTAGGSVLSSTSNTSQFYWTSAGF